MKSSLVLALAAACGTTSSGAPRPAPPPSQQTAAPPAAGSAAMPSVMPAPPIVHTEGAARAAIEAPHAGAIVTLAVTPDGKSAISCDELGGLRLWPALDGTREPVVVELPRPKQLAIGATADGYTVDVLDEVGGVIVASIDRDGRTRSHATLPTEPAYKDIAMTSLGTLAWRADQTIELIGGHGAVEQRLAVEPGQRLIDLSVSGDRALALVETVENGTPARKPRWLHLQPKLSWGGWLRAAVPLGDQIAVSPAGTRYATLVHDDPKQPQQAKVVVLDAAKGTALVDHAAPGVVDLGFPDDDHVAFVASSVVSWLAIGKPGDAPTTPPTPAATSGAMAIGGGRVVSSTNGELVLASPTGAQYLGYAVESPTVAQAAANGQLLIGVGDQFALLDRELRATGAPTVAPKGGTVADVRWLGGDDWLVVASTPEGVTRLELADVAHGTSKTVRDKLTIVPVLMYEPSTRLVTLSLGDSPEVDRYDPVKHAIERVAALPRPKGFEQAELVPLAPAVSGGAELLRVTMRDKPTLAWLNDAKQLTKSAHQISVDNASFAGADPAGHAFVWRNTPQNALELAIYAAGKPIGKLPSDGPVALWPDPKGARVVEVGQRAVSLYTLDGKRVWAQELAGTTEALWLADGAIAIVSAAGIARLDAATGAVTAARCGWRFELSAKPHPATPQIEPVCTQLTR
ncbi:MAG: hypothetical protein ACM31C_35185 [Acidobacteriota bacterium]